MQLRLNSVKNYTHEILSTVGIILTVLAFTVFYRVGNVLERMQNQIQTPKWKISSTLYAEAPILNSGSQVSANWLIDYFQRLKYVEVNDSVVKPGQYPGQYIVRKEGIAFLKRGNASTENDSPIFVAFNKNGIQKLVQLKTGVEMAKVSIDPLPLAEVHGSSWEKQKLIQLHEVPGYALKAVVAIEDRRFYDHGGVDLRSIARAAWNNVSSEKLQGGSTITQQVVKNFYLTPKKSFRRKMNEALMAMLMERKYSKDKILEFYINNVYLGKCGTYNVRGFQAASRLYFKKDARYLSVPEAALLAGMIQAPLRYNPYEYPDKAKGRRDTVLLAMRNSGVISSEDYQKYVEVPIHVEQPDEAIARAPYFVDAVLRQLPEEYSSSELHSDGYQITTTLDMDLQKTAEESLAAGLAAIDKYRIKKTKEKVQGCLIAVEPSTGYVRAFVGGRNFTESQFDRVTQALRHPGSSFKPFVYATALETAFDPSMPYYYTPSTLVDDEPLSMQLTTGKTWEPENYNHQFYGVVSARQALAYSMNVATARLAQQLGVNKISDLSKKAGLKNAKPYPSVALGAFDVTPWDLIQAYTAFANGGSRVEITGVRSVINSKGETIYQSHIVKTPVIHKETAYLITNMLQSVVTSGTAASLRNYGLTQPIAGKTGTSNDYRDAWFVGYTPDLLCLVWVGYDDNKPVKLTGAQAALPIWANFMKKALAGIPVRDFARPEQTVEREIDPTTGKLAGWDCFSRVREIFIKGTEPTEYCTEDDHNRSPESFLGPPSRSTPLVVQNTAASADNDLAYAEDEVPPSDPSSESESTDGFYYIAAPEKSDDSKKIGNRQSELSQEPSDTQQVNDLKSVSNSDTERAPDSEEFQQAIDNGQVETSNDQNQQENSSPPKKKLLRPPKNIDGSQEPQSQPEQN